MSRGISFFFILILSFSAHAYEIHDWARRGDWKKVEELLTLDSSLDCNDENGISLSQIARERQEGDLYEQAALNAQMARVTRVAPQLNEEERAELDEAMEADRTWLEGLFNGRST